MVLAGFGFRDIGVDDWVTCRSPHYSSDDDFYTVVQVWKSVDGEIAALRLKACPHSPQTQIAMLSGVEAVSQIAEWIIHFCNDPPRYMGKFITGPISRQQLGRHAQMLAPWMDPLFSHAAPEVAITLQHALHQRSSAELRHAELDSSIAEARLALHTYKKKAIPATSYRIGLAPEEFLRGDGWAYADCQFLGWDRRPIANPYLKLPQWTRRANAAEIMSQDAQTAIDRMRREYGFDTLSVIRAGVTRAMAAQSVEDFSTCLASWLEHSVEWKGTYPVSETVRRRRILDSARLIRTATATAPEAYRANYRVRALDYAAFLLGDTGTVDIGLATFPVVLEMITGEIDPTLAESASSLDNNSDALKARIIKESWDAAVRRAGEIALPFASISSQVIAPEELAESLTYECGIHERVFRLCVELCSISYGSPMQQTGLLCSLSISNPMMSESSNDLYGGIVEDRWVYWTSVWESNEAAEFDRWVSEQLEQIAEFETEKRSLDARIRTRWGHVAKLKVPDLTDDTWSEGDNELAEPESYDSELDPHGNVLVEICAISNQPACLADVIEFVNSYSPGWMDDEGGMIRAGWRSPGCFFTAGVPELARYVDLVTDLYDLTGTWVGLDLLLRKV